jgi:sulfite reductase (NADPH) hemoprotein beta-component
MISHQVLDQYEQDVTDYLAGRIPDDRFAGLRLLQGVYAQRQEGFCMVRTKLPGGRLDPVALDGFADALERYSDNGHDVVHLTTRQDIQFHYVRLAATPVLLRDMAAAGVTSREASGNTVRNITACPLAGVCPREHVDVTPHLEATARHFLGHPLTRQLPRKFKISFAGCEADCAQGMTHDLAAIATRRDGEPGFRLLAFGGLGAKPFEALEIDPFVPEARLLPAIEAVLSLHHRHSDRKRRSRSRIKFLVARFGADTVRTMYREELAKRTDVPTDAPRGAWHEAEPGTPPAAGGVVRRVTAQRQSGRLALPIAVHLGRLTAPQLRGLAALLRDEGLDELRVTQDQNLLLPFIDTARLDAVRTRLADLDLAEPVTGDNVVSCPGTRYCPLAITGSPYLAETLGGGTGDLRIRVNGCQNSCAQSDTGDLGFYGVAKRHHGWLVPSYVVQLGGNGTAGGGYGDDGPTVPAHRATEATRRIVAAYEAERVADEDFRAWRWRQDDARFDELLGDLVAVGEHEVAALCADLGSDATFAVETVGIGECAGAGIDHLALAEAEITYQGNSRYAFAQADDLSEADACLLSVLDAVNDALAREGAVALPGEVREHDALRGAVATGSTDFDGHQALAARVQAWAGATLAGARERGGAGGLLPTALAS